MKARPIYMPVEGAPFQPGDAVQIARSAETEDSGCGVHALVGRVGRVAYLEYSCGCGQSYPDDPMIGVALGDRVEEFWADELENVPS